MCGNSVRLQSAAQLGHTTSLAIFTTRHALRQTFRRYDATADEIRNIFKLSVSKYIEEL